MDSRFLGSGWNFEPDRDNQGQLDDTGRIAMAQGDESINQAIWNILGTAPGERVMRPDFGCGIHDLVFAVNDAATRSQLAGEVQRALLLWEPRIEVLNVTTYTDSSSPHCLLIEVDFRVRATNNRFNLVYPFYLE